eukprot:c13289_g1_i1.p1 GENE.c13289_g1_i1~~c13289_g1_i1.p1  ORF type:complete len:151 (+),score=56.42 c13289_g1_i1:298-750(+)
MVDPDFPSNYKPLDKDFLLWAVGNISADGNLENATTLCEYIPPCPSKNAGSHRVCFVLAQQESEEKNDFTDFKRINSNTISDRFKFKTAKFFSSRNFELKSVIFFQARYDESVPSIYEKMGVIMPKYVNPVLPKVIVNEKKAHPSRFLNI